jgi:hypothetical protein
VTSPAPQFSVKQSQQHRHHGQVSLHFGVFLAEIEDDAIHSACFIRIFHLSFEFTPPSQTIC